MEQAACPVLIHTLMESSLLPLFDDHAGISLLALFFNYTRPYDICQMMHFWNSVKLDQHLYPVAWWYVRIFEA